MAGRRAGRATERAWGARGNDPGARNVLAPEITLYADQLKMPSDLKNAMTGPSRTRAPFKDVMAEAEQLSKSIAEYWNRP